MSLIRAGRALSLVALVMLSAAPPALSGEFNRVVDIGAPMPEFRDLPAVGGATVSSQDLTEEVVVLVFLANHCPWVRGLDGDLIELVDGFKDREVRFLGVSVNHREADRLSAMEEHAARVGYNFTYVFDESQDLGRKLGATRTPEVFVFDGSRSLAYMGLIHDSPAMMRGDGSIHYTNGQPSVFYARDAIEALLEGEPVAVAETRAQGCSVEYEPVAEQ